MTTYVRLHTILAGGSLGALAQRSLVRVVSNTQLARAEVGRLADAEQNEPAMIGLAGHIERFWQAAQTAKQPIEQIMLRNLRQRVGQYDPSELALIREQGGSEIFMMLTQGKCRGAESWLREILCAEHDKPWGLDPSPMPDLPPYVQEAVVDSVTQEALAAGWAIDDARIDERLLTIKTMAYRRMQDLAKKVAERHELVIADQFADGGWARAVSEFVYDLVTFPTAFIKGPVMRMRKARKWMPGPGGQWVAKVTDVIRPEWERRSPFDIYPAPSMRDIQYGGLIDRHRFTREHLQQLRGVEGYSQDSIDQVIELYGAKGYTSRRGVDMERDHLELRQNEQWDPEGTIEALNYWGSCPGYLLTEWGWQNKIDLGIEIEPHKEYQVEAWKIGRYIIKAQINPDPLGEKPYAKCSFEEMPGAFWGQGLPEIIRDAASMCNAAARAIANNAAIASGPQVEVQVDRLADGEQVTKPYPWKTYQTTTDMTGNNQPAIRFYQPNMNVQELLVIYSHFERVADNVSGFPNYTYGDSRVSGAGRTSSGLAQLMGTVGKGVRRVVAQVDLNVIEPHVARVYDFNMEYHPDPSIKLDLKPVARGSASILIKDQVSMRQKEMLQATLNPIDMEIIGPRGRMEMLRPALASAEFPVDKILPTELELQLVMARLPPPSQMLGKTGPNAAGTPAGQGGDGGGSPAADASLDTAGNKTQGVEQRKNVQGYRDGGLVQGDMHFHFQRDKRALTLRRQSDGSLVAEETDDDAH